MTGTARDLQAEQDHAEWHGWMDAQGYDFADDSDQAEAFAAGMQAERDLAVCASGVTTPHGAGGTPGQAASDRSWTHLGCGGPVVFDISGGFCAGCEAEGLNEDEYAQEPQPAPELAAAMAERDKARDDRNAARNVVAEMLDSFSPSGSGHTARVGQVQIAKWRTRAGLAP